MTDLNEWVSIGSVLVLLYGYIIMHWNPKLAFMCGIISLTGKMATLVDKGGNEITLGWQDLIMLMFFGLFFIILLSIAVYKFIEVYKKRKSSSEEVN